MYNSYISYRILVLYHGSKKYDPLETDIDSIPDIDTKYYCPQIHRAAIHTAEVCKRINKIIFNLNLMRY